jgi:hypothetical protein
MNFQNLTGPVSLNIYDINGRKVYNNLFDNIIVNQSQIISIPVKQLLPPGLYFVTGYCNGGEFNEKLIVK